MSTSTPAEPSALMPLQNMLFEIKMPEGPDSIVAEKRVPHNSSTREQQVMAMQAPLDRITLIKYALIGKDGTIGSEVDEPIGIQVAGMQNVTWLKEHGVILFSEGALKGVTFKRPPGQDQLIAEPQGEAEDTADLRSMLNLHGIKFSEGANSSVIITDEASICAVALCGGSFTGSSQYLTQHRGALR